MTRRQLPKAQSLLLQQLQVERDDAIARAEAAEASTSELGHKYNDLAGVAGRLRERAKAAEAALAAVPIAELRRIVEMHNAHQWSSVEGPPLWAKVENWLEKQK